MYSSSLNHQPQQPHVNVQERRFVCPLAKKVMTDAVRIITTGKSYERKALLEWIEQNGEVCPVTGTPFNATVDIETNYSLQWEILFWQRQGAERQPIECDIPAPFSHKMSRRNSIAKSIDSPPTRPRRRGSGDSLSSSSEAPTIEQNTNRFMSCCPSGISSCSSSMSLRPPRRCNSTDSLELFQPEDDDDFLFQEDDVQSGMPLSRLVSILDEALVIIDDD